MNRLLHSVLFLFYHVFNTNALVFLPFNDSQSNFIYFYWSCTQPPKLICATKENKIVYSFYSVRMNDKCVKLSSLTKKDKSNKKHKRTVISSYDSVEEEEEGTASPFHRKPHLHRHCSLITLVDTSPTSAIQWTRKSSIQLQIFTHTHTHTHTHVPLFPYLVAHAIGDKLQFRLFAIQNDGYILFARRLCR